jgi:hypothetical protein
LKTLLLGESSSKPSKQAIKDREFSRTSYDALLVVVEVSPESLGRIIPSCDPA